MRLRLGYRGLAGTARLAGTASLARAARLAGIAALAGVMMVAGAGCGADKGSGDAGTKKPPQPSALLLEIKDLPAGYQIDTKNPSDLGGKDDDTGNTVQCYSIAEDPADTLGADAEAEADRTFIADTSKPYVQQYIARYADDARALGAIKRLTDATAGCNGFTSTEDGVTLTYRSKQISFPPQGDQTVATQLSLEGSVGGTANVVVVRVGNVVTLVMHHSRQAPPIGDLEPVVTRAVAKLKSGK